MGSFPYSRGIAEDLRDLFGFDRLSGWARTLGSSSITAGEGGLQLVSGTTTIAVLGDLPGGGFGVGIPNGSGGFVTVQDHVAAKFAALRASDIISNNGTVQSDLIWASNRAESAHTRLNSLTASQVASGSGTVQADLTYLGSELVKANNRISNLTASQIATGSGNVANDLTYLGAEAASASSRIGGLTTRMGSAEGSIGSLSTSVGSLAGRADSLEFRMYQAEQRNGEQQDEINELRRRINSAGIPP